MADRAGRGVLEVHSRLPGEYYECGEVGDGVIDRIRSTRQRSSMAKTTANTLIDVDRDLDRS